MNVNLMGYQSTTTTVPANNDCYIRWQVMTNNDIWRQVVEVVI